MAQKSKDKDEDMEEWKELLDILATEKYEEEQKKYIFYTFFSSFPEGSKDQEGSGNLRVFATRRLRRVVCIFEAQKISVISV